MLVIKLGLLMTLIGGSEANYGRSESDLGTDTNLEVDDIQDDEPEQFIVSRKKDNENDNNPSLVSQQASTSVGNKHKRGRSQSQNSIKTKRRAQSHILLVGDPGTGKSQFLRFAAALSPRSVLTTGVGTTSAGLTCAAVREGSSKEFTLEAGALVLADRGVCCIDEFGCIRNEDRVTIHEAMEQQTLSIAKAGIVCKLNARATVVAVMNPKGSLYVMEDSVSKNTNIGSPLLSRFDLIFVMLDESDLERDDKIASFLLKHAIQGSDFDPSSNYSTTVDQSTSHNYWSMDKLRAYIATVKEKFHPTLSPEASILLQRHYRRCRESSSVSVQITVRFLESLIRLSQAHARLMYRNVVTLQDAVAVVLIMETSAFTSGGLRGDYYGDQTDYLYKQPMQVDFPSNEEADAEFMVDQYTILHRYDMLDYLPEDQKISPLNGNSPTKSEGFPTDFNMHVSECSLRDEGVSMSKQHNTVDCWGRTHSSPMPPRRDMGHTYVPLGHHSMSEMADTNKKKRRHFRDAD